MKTSVHVAFLLTMALAMLSMGQQCNVNAPINFDDINFDDFIIDNGAGAPAPDDGDSDDADDDDDGNGDDEPEPQPPVFTMVPDALELDCGMEEAAATLESWLDSAVAETDDTCEGAVDIAYEYVGLADDCTPDGWSIEVVWTATNECGLTADASSVLVLLNTGDPAISLIQDESLTLECHIDAYIEPGATASFDCAGITIPATSIGDDVDWTTPGTYEAAYTLEDDCGHTAEVLMQTVVVEDTLPPEVVEDRITELWPPNGRYVTLTLADCVVIEDACAGELDVDELGTILSIYSDEPEDVGRGGDGNTRNDIVIIDEVTFQVRSERQGGGDGRVYGVEFEVTDHEGHTINDVCYITVPHDQSGSEAVDDGPAYTIEP